ncbi:hypothetical protein LPB136_11370 [Tenacibaculum todarodis]|uniref:DUF3987 domain-containing protein n=1 Tax=Tenacibaculum todarodis TaxID=1850252 RepID=A0A1L3JL86_9FLAO|nr:hypothetical protein LPB136_11370 [Tenacibaculum todarodis]
MIKDAEKTEGYYPDYLSAGILSNVATAMGSNFRLDNGSYDSQPILWLVIVGQSGGGKTHPLNFAKKPIEEKDKQNYLVFQTSMKKYNARDDKKGNKPSYVKSILSDFTPEKLAENLQHNEKGVLIFKDELIGWIKSFDQYRKGADQQLYLELFNGGTLSVDRVSKPSIRVEKTNVNVLGGIQPSALKDMAKNNRNDDGFLARFLFVYPIKSKPNLFSGNKIQSKHTDGYKKFIHDIYNADNINLKASSSQIKIYQKWQHKKVKQYHNDDSQSKIQAKLQTYVWRLALIIEIMEQANCNKFTNTISDTSIEKAIKLAEYFRMTAIKVYDKISPSSPLDSLPKNKADLYKALPKKFKRSEVLPIIEEHNIKGGTINRFLSNNELFIRLDGNGNYEKRV